MTAAAAGLEEVRSLAIALAQPDASAATIAATLGPCHDPFGRGDQWLVDHPRVPAVLNAVVLVDPATGAPDLVSLVYAPDRGPRLQEVEAVFGAGAVVAPFDWEPWRLVYDGPRTDEARATLVVTTDAETGDEDDPRVTEIAIRRDRV